MKKLLSQLLIFVLLFTMMPSYVVHAEDNHLGDFGFWHSRSQSNIPGFDQWGSGGGDQFEIIVENLPNERMPSSWFPEDTIKELIN